LLLETSQNSVVPGFNRQEKNIFSDFFVHNPSLKSHQQAACAKREFLKTACLTCKDTGTASELLLKFLASILPALRSVIQIRGEIFPDPQHCANQCQLDIPLLKLRVSNALRVSRYCTGICLAVGDMYIVQYRIGK
jgi:hypothetical protein